MKPSFSEKSDEIFPGTIFPRTIYPGTVFRKLFIQKFFFQGIVFSRTFFPGIFVPRTLSFMLRKIIITHFFSDQRASSQMELCETCKTEIACLKKYEKLNFHTFVLRTDVLSSMWEMFYEVLQWYFWRGRSRRRFGRECVAREGARRRKKRRRRDELLLVSRL